MAVQMLVFLLYIIVLVGAKHGNHKPRILNPSFVFAVFVCILFGTFALLRAHF